MKLQKIRWHYKPKKSKFLKKLNSLKLLAKLFYYNKEIKRVDKQIIGVNQRVTKKSRSLKFLVKANSGEVIRTRKRND